jgi:hypothetical protein
MEDITGDMLGILPPVIAAGAVMGIMNQMNGNNKGGGMFGASATGGGMTGALSGGGGTRIDGTGGSIASPGAKKISQRSAIKLFGVKKAMLAKSGTEVTNEDGEVLFYDSGFYLA